MQYNLQDLQETGIGNPRNLMEIMAHPLTQKGTTLKPRRANPQEPGGKKETLKSRLVDTAVAGNIGIPNVSTQELRKQLKPLWQKLNYQEKSMIRMNNTGKCSLRSTKTLK